MTATSSLANGYRDGPDEPDHPRRCDECKRWLPRYGWEYDPIPEERIIVWYWYCTCGKMVTHEC